ncbi:hypothetical protein [Streptomyces sp. B21-083]|uniref:hypothetical protein n=1 Tax=Streptomyces sp. B21-083 TaxID=3039410 RepID=UPI002FF3C31C
MDGESLDGEDYASVHLATQSLTPRYFGTLTLNARLEGWAEFVTDVEDGFDSMWAWQFDNDATHRDWLHDAWPILTERVRRVRQPELDALDERFRAATAPMTPFGTSPSEMAEQTRWWRFRYPLRVTGDPDAELPARWSPPPVHIE